MEAVIIGSTFTCSLVTLTEILESVVKLASIEATKQYKIETLKDTVISTRDAGKYLDCTAPTIITYINKGHRDAGSLPAIYSKKGYKINKYDLYLFKLKMKA
jgi:hypothetical protein